MTEASTDLWDLLSSGAFKRGGSENPAKSKAQKEKARKARQREETLQAQQALEEKLHHVVDEMLMWEPRAIVRVLYTTTCTCGEYFELPEIFPQGLPCKPLVRYVHKRTGQTWERRADPFTLRSGLPEVVREIPTRATYCPTCLGAETEREILISSAQLPLPLGDH